jgi:transcriptional regulator with XRE-family HTH domain
MAKSAKILRNNIRRLLEQRGMSQTELARKCGIAQSNIAQILSEANENPGLERIEAIAEALGVKPYQLLMDPGDKPVLTEADYAEAVRVWAQSLAKKYKSLDGVLHALLGGLSEALKSEELNSKK